VRCRNGGDAQVQLTVAATQPMLGLAVYPATKAALCKARATPSPLSIMIERGVMKILPRALGPSRTRLRRRLMEALAQIDRTICAILRFLWKSAVEGLIACGTAMHGRRLD
jgi:hypothetical protein